MIRKRVFSENDYGNIIVNIECTQEEEKKLYNQQREALKDVLIKSAEEMLSEDYKVRFKAEYKQIVARAKLLNAMLRAHEKGVLDFTPSCNITLLERQLEIMSDYALILIKRGEEEGIELNGCLWKE